MDEKIIEYGYPKGKFIHGDCLQEMQNIPNNSVDMILCDLPYGTTACKWDSIISLALLWEQYIRIIKHKSAIVLTASQPFTTNLISSNYKLFKYNWVWEKSKGSNFQHSKYQPIKVHEDIVIFSKSGSAQGSLSPMNYNPQMIKGKEYQGFNNPIGKIGHLSAGNIIASTTTKGALRYPRSVQFFVTAENEGKLHPTQKPVALFEYLIKTYTNKGDTVLDNCAGSGTTAIAAINTRRNWICIEKEQEYFNLAVDRIDKHIASFKT